MVKILRSSWHGTAAYDCKPDGWGLWVRLPYKGKLRNNSIKKTIHSMHPMHHSEKIRTKCLDTKD